MCRVLAVLRVFLNSQERPLGSKTTYQISNKYVRKYTIQCAWSDWLTRPKASVDRTQFPTLDLSVVSIFPKITPKRSQNRRDHIANLYSCRRESKQTLYLSRKTFTRHSFMAQYDGGVVARLKLKGFDGRASPGRHSQNICPSKRCGKTALLICQSSGLRHLSCA